MTVEATSANETPVLFEAGGEELFGLITEPTVPPLGIGVLLLSGGAWIPSVGRGRIWTRMARRMAAHGFHAMRMDYHGVGESTGDVSTYRLDEPFVDDALAAVRAMEARGLSSFVAGGSCFGARTALALAEAHPGVVGVALFPVPVRDFTMGERLVSRPTAWYAKKALDRSALLSLKDRRKRRAVGRLVVGRMRRTLSRRAPVDRWVSPQLVRQLDAVLQRGVHVLMAFGTEDDSYEDFAQARRRDLRPVLDRAGDLVTMKEVPGKLHGLANSQA